MTDSLINPAPLLTYEQPLAPGEFRIEPVDDGVTLKWSLLPRQSRNMLISVSLWALAYLCYLSWKIYEWNIRGRHWSGLIFVAFFGLLTLQLLRNFIQSARTAGVSYAILASRELIIFNYPTGSGTIPVTAISHFTARDRTGGGYELTMHLRQKLQQFVPGYQFRLSKPARNSVEILAHPDPDLVERASASLNALLTPAAIEESKA
jgi:hypothetical protein